MRKNVAEISQDVIAILMNYDFLGNVRELENIIERGVALSNGDTIETSHLHEDYIIPGGFDRKVVSSVAHAVAETARKTGLARH